MLNGNGNAIVRYDLSMRRNDWDQIANEESYIGFKVMPAAAVAKPSSSFTRLSLASTFTPVEDNTRVPRGAYKRDESGWTTDTYSTVEKGRESAVDDAEVEMYGDFLPVEQIAAQRVTSLLLAEHEQAVANAVFNTGAYTGNQTIAAGTTFSNLSSATPISLIFQAKYQCRKYGVKANALVIPQIALDWMLQCSQLIDRLKYSGIDDPKNISIDALKAIFKIDNILVGDGWKNPNPDGTAPAFSRFWDPTMLWVGRIADSQTELTSPSVCVGRTVMYQAQNAKIPGLDDGSGESAIIMEEYREEQRRGGVIRGRWNWAVKPFDDPMADGTFYRAGVLVTGVTDGTIL